MLSSFRGTSFPGPLPGALPWTPWGLRLQTPIIGSEGDGPSAPATDPLRASECTKFVLHRGSAPHPALGVTTLLRPLVGWGGVHSLPIPVPLDAFGVSVSTPSAFRSRCLQCLLVCPNLFFVPARLQGSILYCFQDKLLRPQTPIIGSCSALAMDPSLSR